MKRSVLICFGLLVLAPISVCAQSIRSQIANILISEEPSLVDVYESKTKIERLLIIKKIDLNGDKAAEYLVNGVMCGAQNCPYYILQKKAGKLVRVPGEIEGIFQRVLPTKSKGWRDLVFAWHSSATRAPKTTYRFNGHKYIAR